MGYDENQAQAYENTLDTGSEIGKQGLKKGLEYNSKGGAKEAAKNASKEAAKDTAKEAGKEGAKTVAKEGGKEAAVQTAAAGAAATGVGVPVAAAIEIADVAARILKGGLNVVSKSLTGDRFRIVEYIAAPIILIFLYMFLISAGRYGMVGSSSEKYSEEQYYNTQVEKGSVRDIRSVIRDFIKFFIMGEDEEPGEYDSNYILDESLVKTNIPIFEKAFEKSYELAQKEIVLIISEREYDYELTMESFEEQGYPFEDINYAELISIISQKPEFNIENMKFRKLKKLFNDEKKIKYLYKMKVEDAYATVTYYEIDGKEIRLGENESPPNDEEGNPYDTHSKEVKYGKVTLKHYDLKNLYTKFLELEPNEPNEHYKSVNNIDMIDSQEERLRYYARDDERQILGSKQRTIWDWGFDAEDHDIGAMDYDLLRKILEALGIDPDDLDKGDIKYLFNGNIEEAQAFILKMAFSKLGTKYSQALRNEEGYFDCSSFVAWAYRQIGIDFGSFSPTAAEECRYLTNAGREISTSYNESIMKPGDIIFYRDTTSDKNLAASRYRHVTHTAIYVGDGKMIDASSGKGEVVYRNVWGKDKIISVCRPLQ